MTDDWTEIGPQALLGKRLGPYVLDSVIGQGGMGTVYGATVKKAVGSLQPGDRVAVKTIHDRLLGDDVAVARFEREGRLGMEVDHPNVVRTYEIGTRRIVLRKVHLLVMEYVEGRTLERLLADSGPLPEALCGLIGRDIASALAAIHARGVIHRDLKPSNVILTPDHVVKVMDLGIARDMETSLEISMPGSFIGSVAYASPEQLTQDARDLDARTDLWALGLTLYHLAAGVHPFPAENVGQAVNLIVRTEPPRLGSVRPQVSPFLEEVVHALLCKDPDARLGPAARVVEILESGESDSWWSAQATTIRESNTRPPRRARIPHETALHGRDAELRDLRALYDVAAAGEGRTVLIRGEAGSGKTRLVEELLVRLRADGEDVDCVSGSFAPGGVVVPADGFAAVLREGEPSPDATRRDAIANAARALAARRPTILLIDDLHFAGDDRREVFAGLSLALAGEHVLLIGTAAPGVAAAWLEQVARPDHASLLELAPLGEDDVGRLVGEALASDEASGARAAQVAAASGGNPYFALEIARDLRSGRISTRDPERLDVPASVRDLIGARIAGLGDDDRDVLDVAACYGREFDPALVGEVLDVAAIPALLRLGRIETSHGLVCSAGRHMRFAHHEVQETLLAGLAAKARATCDRAIRGLLDER